MTDEKRWYVVYVGDSRRVSALPEAVRSASRDSAVWIPTKQEFFRVKDKLKEVTKPLFKGYVFVNTSLPAADLEEVIKAACGGYFLKGPGRRDAFIISDEEIKYIHTLVDENKYPKSIAEQYDLEIGQHVEITAGSLEGFKGFITGLKKEKVVVEVSFFGRNTSAEVDPAACRVFTE